MSDGFAREQDMRRLKAEIERLWADIKVVKEQLAHMGRREAEGLRGQMGPQLDGLRQQAEELLVRLRERTDETVRPIKDGKEAKNGLAELALLGMALLALKMLKR